MSGSYDRPPRSGVPLPPPPQPRTRPRQDGMTGPDAFPQTGPPSMPYGIPAPYAAAPSSQYAHIHPDAAPDAQYTPPDAWSSQTAGDPPPRLEPEPSPPPHRMDDLRAEERSAPRVNPKTGNAAIVPAGSVTGNSLTLVIAIMCFLACLTAGAVYMVNQSASAWLSDIASEVTVQVEPREKADTERIVKDVTAFLGKQPGMKTVRALSLEESTALIEPWLGQGDALKALPVPRLIAIEVDRQQPPDLSALGKALAAQFPKGVTLDDHRQWQQQIRTVTRSLALGGIAILMLVGAATTAIIVSAARSAMASNHEIVEVLHLVGATDKFIAGEFERHFQRLGIRAGLVGAGFAVLVFGLLPSAMELLGGGAVTLAELQRLVGLSGMDPLGYGVLGVVVVVIAILCRLTSRFGVYRILDTQR